MLDESSLVFVISQPRAGSTLLQATLSNNKLVDTTSEPWLLLPFLSIFKPEVNKASYDSNYLKNVLPDFLEKMQLSGFFREGIKEIILNTYAKAKSENSIYFLDKTPRYYEILDEIVEYFPNAKIIILKRNPIDVLDSIIRTWKVQNYKHLYLYHRDILHAPFLIQNFLSKNKHNAAVKEVNYNDLVSENKINVYKELFSWLGIPFEGSYLDYSGNYKYKGLFGDPVSVSKYKKPEAEIRKTENLRASKKWAAFFEGYQQYLGSKFLKEYLQIEDFNLPVFNQKKSSLKQLFYNLKGAGVEELDFNQFKYLTDRGINNYYSKYKFRRRDLWRFLNA